MRDFLRTLTAVHDGKAQFKAILDHVGEGKWEGEAFTDLEPASPPDNVFGQSCSWPSRPTSVSIAIPHIERGKPSRSRPKVLTRRALGPIPLEDHARRTGG